MYIVDGDDEQRPLILQVTPRAPLDAIDGFEIRPGEIERLASLLFNTGLDFSESLVERVVREASNSDPLFGSDFEHTSPLAPNSSSGVDEFNESMARTTTRAVNEDGYPTVSFVATPGDSPIVSMAFDADTIGAVSFHPDAFVVAVDPGLADVEVEFDFSDDEGRAFIANQMYELQQRVSDSRTGAAIVWRLYSGNHSNSTDGVTEGWRARVDVGSVVGPAVLVGRLAMFSHGRLRRDRRDPLYRFRRASGAEEHPHQRTAYPAIETVATCGSSAVIAVHGTMASGVDLAAAIVDELGQHRLVLRFEHDTWLPITENASELVGHIERLGLDHVTFVAHSRGGLVAREVMNALASSNRVKSAMIALGAPFKGTPIVDGVDGGLLALTALMGMLGHVTGPAGFVAGRLAGLLVKFRLPPGIQDMGPASSFIGTVRPVNNDITAFAGSIDAQSERSSHGLGKNLAYGFATGVFGATENDYIVAAESSRYQVADARVTHVESDHFSYLTDSRVKAALRGIDASTNISLVIDD